MAALTPDPRPILRSAFESVEPSSQFNSRLNSNGNSVANQLSAVEITLSEYSDSSRLQELDFSRTLDSILETLDSPQSPPRPTDLQSQRLADRYQLQGVLGRGSSGTVFKAFDELLARFVAIKILHQPPGIGGFAIDQFVEEARSLALLSHQGIVQIHDFGTTSASAYLVTEIVNGPTLRQFLKSHGPIHYRTATRITAAIAGALSYAHRCGVIHRDLKPSNILLSPREPKHSLHNESGEQFDVKLADFGLAKQEEAARFEPQAKRVGTPAYMSPEAACGSSVSIDARSDVFGLGAIFFELLTGRQLFEGRVDQLLHSIQHDQIPRPREIHAEIPVALEAICLKCLEKRPDDRYQTATELLHAVQRWLDEDALEAQKGPLPTLAFKWGRRPNPFTALTIAASLMFAIGSIGGLGIQAPKAREQTDRSISEARLNALMKMEDGHLSVEMDELRKDPFAISLAKARLVSDGVELPQRIRLLLVTGPRSPAEANELFEYAVQHASASEFSLIVEHLDPTLVARTQFTLPSGELDESDFRLALIQLHKCKEADIAKPAARRLAMCISAGAFPERVLPWVEQMAPFRTEIFRGHLENQGAHHESGLAQNRSQAVFIQIARGDTAMLCSLASMVEGADLAELQKELTSNPEVAMRQLLTISKDAREQIELMTHLTGPDHSNVDLERAWMRYSRIVNAVAAITPLHDQWDHLFSESDPRLDAYFIDSAINRGLTVARIADLLANSSSPTAQRAMILALHKSSKSEIKGHSNLMNWMKNQFVKNPSSGVHSAIRFTLENLQEQVWLEMTDLQLHGKVLPKFEWFVNSADVTMVLGPQGGMGRQPRSDRPRLAISATEITRRHLGETGIKAPNPSSTQSLRMDLPANWISLETAIAFCQQLNQRDGIEDRHQPIQKVFQPLHLGDASFVRIENAAPSAQFELDLLRSGYRLPTMSELHMACQAGATTEVFFGGSNSPHADGYVNPDLKRPVSSFDRMPNRIGVFHSLGNVQEWTIDRSSDELNATDSIRVLHENSRVKIFDGLRDWRSPTMRARFEHSQPAKQRQATLGFRVVCVME